MIAIFVLTCWPFLLFLVIELAYWLIYFPRAWRDGSNREIADIRAAFSSDSGK